MNYLAPAALALAIAISGAAHALEAVTVTPLTTRHETASGQPITLPQKDVRVVVSIFDIAPGAKLPVHKHPFARYGVVESGSLEVTNVETGDSTVYTKGDFIVEMIDHGTGRECRRRCGASSGHRPDRGRVENTLLRAR